MKNKYVDSHVLKIQFNYNCVVDVNNSFLWYKQHNFIEHIKNWRDQASIEHMIMDKLDHYGFKVRIYVNYIWNYL